MPIKTRSYIIAIILLCSIALLSCKKKDEETPRSDLLKIDVKTDKTDYTTNGEIRISFEFDLIGKYKEERKEQLICVLILSVKLSLS